MLKLSRLTSAYADTEDRFQFLGMTDEATHITLWLTQRLLRRVIPRLLQWLENQPSHQLHTTANSKQDRAMLQSFAQQAARTNYKNTPPVSCSPRDRAELVSSVHIAHAAHGIRLVFNTSEAAAAGIVLETEQLRQWLDILRRQWHLAGWPRDIWPAWLGSSSQANDISINSAAH